MLGHSTTDYIAGSIADVDLIDWVFLLPMLSLYKLLCLPSMFDMHRRKNGLAEKRRHVVWQRRFAETMQKTGTRVSHSYVQHVDGSFHVLLSIMHV